MFVKPVPPSAVWWHKAVLIRWVDGDTAIVNIDRSFNMHRVGARVRMAKINCPERFTDAGKDATAFVNALVPPGSEVLVYSHKDSTGKYGRIEGEICFEGVNVNRAILENHHAVIAN